MRRLLGLTMVVTLFAGGCAPSVPLACGPLARMPTPVAGDELVRLQEIADSVAAELGVRKWEINLLDADETRGTVVVGSTKPSVELCDTLHERYGPLIEVIYQEPIELFG